MKRILVLLLALLLLAGCGAQPPAETTVPTTEAATEATTVATTEPKRREDMQIFISLPAEDARWQAAGEDLLMLLQNLCYQVTLSYGEGDAMTQAQQLTEAIETGVDCILLAPVDSAALSEVGALALEQGIPMIAYDRMVMDTEAVQYYVSYDYKAMGRAMAEHIVEKADPDTAEKPLTIEFFMGAPEDHSAFLVYAGVMEVLQPYLEAGKLVTKSGRTAFEDTCTLENDAAAVEKAMRTYLQEDYKGTRPDIICTANDDFVAACITAIEARKRELPLFTGIGATEAGLANLEAGKQSFTVETDLYLLDEKTVSLVDAVLWDKEPELNDTENTHNNAATIPSYLCEFTAKP
ncbi:MAG: sugar-binding protein [Oscillospiraceae bacterium]|nr:sugar-binding protein [Oscillospiraceae bacterium]